MRLKNTKHGLAVVVMSLFTAGCVSTPYIGNPRPDLVDGRNRITDYTLKRGSMEYAIALADNTFDAYQAKLDEEFQRQQMLSTGLLALSAALVGAATGSVHRDVFVVGALGGGLAYQLGTWNSNASRLGIYLEGMKALTCAKTAIAPLRWTPGQAERVVRLTRSASVGLASAADAVGEVTQWLALSAAEAATASELVKTARMELEQSQRLFSHGDALLGRAAATSGRVEGAGAMLEQHVETIQRQISESLRGTLADLRQLPGQINAISQYANLFTPDLKFDAALGQRIDAINKKIPRTGSSFENKDDAAAVVARVDPEAQLARSLGRLRASSLKLSALLVELHGALDNAANAQIQESLKSCGVDPAKLTSILKLDRDTVTLQAGSAQSTLVTVAGGTSPYATSIIDTPHDGVAAEVLAGTNQIRITVAATVTGDRSYSVRVADSTGQSVNLSVKVTAAAMAPKGGSEGKDARSSRTAAPCADQGQFNRAQICLIQKQTAAIINGRLDGATCTAFNASRFGETGKIDSKSWRQIAQSAGLSETALQQDIRAQMDPLELMACDTGKGRRGVPRSAAPLVPALPATTAVAAGANAAGPRTDFEAQLTDAQIRQRRLQLGLPGDPALLDDKFRDLVSRKQREKGTSRTDGTLDPQTMQMLEKLPAGSAK